MIKINIKKYPIKIVVQCNFSQVLHLSRVEKSMLAIKFPTQAASAAL